MLSLNAAGLQIRPNKCKSTRTKGKNHRLKNKKRECYGRAGFELLRRKVILSNYG